MDVGGRARHAQTTPARSALELLPVALPDELQALEREPVVHLVHLLAEGHDPRRETARGDRGGLLAQLLAQPADDRVDLAGEPVHDARLDGLLRALPDRVPRLLYVHARQPRRARRERLQRDLDAGRDHTAEVLAV